MKSNVDSNTDVTECCGAALKECDGCNRTESRKWMHGPNGEKTLCTTCGMRYRRNGTLEYKQRKVSVLTPPKERQKHKRKYTSSDDDHSTGTF